MDTFDGLATPSILVDRAKLAANIHSMQAVCDENRVELRPHIKTHKMVAVARQQLAAGARGLTCAKLGEAEAMLPSGVRSLFVAHSLVDVRQAPRIAALLERVEDFRIALTSEAHLEPLTRLAIAVGRKLTVMMAIDTGLGREGMRDPATALRLAAALVQNPHLELRGFYSHEGHLYAAPREQLNARVAEMLDLLSLVRDAIDPALALWPGCSVTARLVASDTSARVQAVRPGAYVFGDLALTQTTGIMAAEDVAVHVLSTVVDRPEPGLALIDAGSKTFSTDRTAQNIYAIAADGRDISVVRVNEEHGYLRGTAVDALRIGERIRFTPAHVCPVINLTSHVTVIEGNAVVETWPVEARGRTQ
jgi:D-serine deaminase-like pyridoxal phosphate-dependent protein